MTSTQLETVQRLAETDPYWRGYADGLTDKHHLRQEATTQKEDQ